MDIIKILHQKTLEQPIHGMVFLSNQRHLHLQQQQVVFECTHTLLKSLADLFTGPQIPLAGTFTLLTELTLRLEDTKQGNYTLTPKKRRTSIVVYTGWKRKFVVTDLPKCSVKKYQLLKITYKENLMSCGFAGFPIRSHEKT